MQKTEKILIIGPNWIGDMVIAQTLFILLKQHNPNAIIDVIAPPWTAPLLEYMPEVNSAIIQPFKHGELSLVKRYKFAKKLRENKYDQAIILPNSLKSALIPFWAKIPKRTGWRGEMRFGLINDLRTLDKNKLSLMIERFANLGLDKNELLDKKLPWPKLHIFQNFLIELKKAIDFDPLSPILALCPGAEYGPAKRWPAEYFATVANAKLNEGWQVWLFGSKNDEIAANKIQELTDDRCNNFVAKTDLNEATTLLSLANIVISNDTGLMHIAAALDKPLIVVYGSSSPKYTPPLTQKAKVLSLNLPCSPCFERTCKYGHYKCLRDLSPELVISSFQQ